MALLLNIHALSANLLSGLFTPDQLRQFLGENYSWILFGFFVFSSLGLTLLTYADGWFPVFSSPQTQVPPDFEQKVREWLRKRYQRRLDQKLAGRLPLNLRRIDFTNQALQLDARKKFKSISPENVDAALHEFFSEAEGRLLVVGQPGTGKTTTLLQLAVALIDSQPDALPLVVNLATWAGGGFTSLEDWLKRALQAELSALPDRFWAEHRVILLFDGLDEIANEYERVACLKMIDRFESELWKDRAGNQRVREFALSSRLGEWVAATNGWKQISNVSFAVEIGKLNRAQLQNELQRLQAEVNSRELLAALEGDLLLLQAVETPFYFNCLQLLYAEGQRPVFSTSNVEEREKEILDAFVQHELSKCRHPETSKWLAFLASRMQAQVALIWRKPRDEAFEKELEIFNARTAKIEFLTQEWLAEAQILAPWWSAFVHKPDFELTDLQYAWWKKWKNLDRLLGRVMNALVDAFAVMLIFSLLFPVFIVAISRPKIGASGFDPVFGLLFSAFFLLLGLFLWLLYGILVGAGAWLISFFRQRPIGIEVKESPWRWGIAIRALKEGFLPALLVYTALTGMVAIGAAIGRMKGIDVDSYPSWLAFGLFVCLGMTFTAFFKNQPDTFRQITTPYQRFASSMKSLHFSILQHFLLRWQLSRKKLLPFRLVAFLHEMAAFDPKLEQWEQKQAALAKKGKMMGEAKPEQPRRFTERPVHLLESSGASWRFRHRLIQEWFATRWIEPR